MNIETDKNSYYGRQLQKKPKGGVHQIMIEEWVQSLMDKAADYHAQQLNKIRTELKKETKKILIDVVKRIEKVESILKKNNKGNQTEIQSEVIEMKEIKDKLIAKGIKVND